MTEVNIEYCVPCGLREYAVETQETLLDEFGRDLIVIIATVFQSDRTTACGRYGTDSQ